MTVDEAWWARGAVGVVDWRDCGYCKHWTADGCPLRQQKKISLKVEGEEIVRCDKFEKAT